MIIISYMYVLFHDRSQCWFQTLASPSHHRPLRAAGICCWSMRVEPLVERTRQSQATFTSPATRAPWWVTLFLFNSLNHVIFEGLNGEDTCERQDCGYTMYSCLREWWWPWKGPTCARCFDKYKLIETSSMSGPFSGPPSLFQERIHGVTANLLSLH